jgi:hypothetical protein
MGRLAISLSSGANARPEHLLVAVVDKADPEAIGVLKKSGIEIGRLRDQAMRILGRTRRPALDPVAAAHPDRHYGPDPRCRSSISTGRPGQS